VLLMMVLGGMLCGVPSASVAAIVYKQDQIKAAFLYNIPKFVEWPADRFPDPDAPIIIGVLGDGALRQQLETIVKERKINGRAVVVRQVSTVEEIKAVHLLFVRAEDDEKFAALGRAVQDSPVLTAGESAAFANAGGMFNFVLAGDKVRFEINMAAAERAQLKISAQLQKLATAIRRTP
jgi:hypothetical protein